MQLTIHTPSILGMEVWEGISKEGEVFLENTSLQQLLTKEQAVTLLQDGGNDSNPCSYYLLPLTTWQWVER